MNWRLLRARSTWVGLAVIAVVFVALAAMSWRKWPDPLIDFGQQLYVPWRLSQGAVLYHNVSYVYGCLSVYYNAALFKLFGVSLNVLLVSNFLILIFLLLTVYWQFLKCSDVWTATTIGLALTVLAFSELLNVGNYNYICPYSHEEVHGIVLSVLMITFLARWLQTGKSPPLARAGVCLGLIFLTKPEVFVGAVAPLVAAMLFQVRRFSLVKLVRSAVVVMVAALVPLAGFFFGFRWEMNSADALRAVCGAWLPLLHSTGLQLPIYQAMTGLDAPWYHIGQALVEFGLLAVVVGICAWRLNRPDVRPVERAVLFGLAGGASINYGWQSAGHCLPLLLLIAAVFWWREWRLTRPEAGGLATAGTSGSAPMRPSPAAKLFFPALWLAFGVAMLAKLGFNPQISHFGVFLAMPALLSAIYLLLYLLPRALADDEWRVTGVMNTLQLSAVRRASLSPFRVAILILLLAGLARLVIQSALFYKDKDFTLGSGGDRMVTYDPKVNPTGAAMASAAAWLKTHTPPHSTLAVMPEGVMLNYLLRRDNPTPYVVFEFEVWAFGEQNMLAAYKAHPPDYIVLIQRDSSEYGVPYFGLQKGYGYDIMRWVKRNYKRVGLIGAVPLQPGGAFGIEILQRVPR